MSRQQLETQPFEYCPLAQIAGAAGRSGGRVFDTLVVYENYPLHDADRLELGDVTIRDMHGTTTSSYPLSLVALPGRQLVLRMLFDGRHYSARTAQRLLEQTATLLRAMADQPEALVRDLALAHVGPVDLSSEQSDSAKESGLVVRVLDSAGQPAPIEMPGELWTGTTGVTQLRTTGYRACRCQDGTIEYLGPGVSAFDRRMSDAASLSPIVRVGRFSVDTAEVAAILRLHPLVADLAVAGFADHERATQLAAYVVPNQQARVAIESVEHGLLLAELRRFLAERVPESMIPTAWRAVARLPLDEAGSVDLAALPSPIRSRSESLAPYVAPRDAVEERVATLWSAVLGVQPVGVTDGFLDLGGYSSLAVALLARVEEEFGRRLPLAALFAEPTVAAHGAIAECHSRYECE